MQEYLFAFFFLYLTSFLPHGHILPLGHFILSCSRIIMNIVDCWCR